MMNNVNKMLILTSVSSCMILSNGCNKSIEETLNGQTYLIPRENLLHSSTKDFSSASRLDQSHSIRLAFSETEVKAALPEFRIVDTRNGRNPDAVLTAVVGVPSDQTRRAILSGTINTDMWRGTGDYNKLGGLGRRIEPEPNGGFRIYYEGIDNIWVLVDRHPQLRDDEPLPPFNAVIGTCRIIRPSRTSYSCRRVVYLDTVLVEYNFDAENVEIYPDIDQFIASKLRQWQHDE